MPRPCKKRRICMIPKNRIFAPLNVKDTTKNTVVMTFDEYETIRLIDLIGLSREETANCLGVARTTAQQIYNSARIKLAKSLIDGCTLIIDGGDYAICEETTKECGCNFCHRRNVK